SSARSANCKSSSRPRRATALSKPACTKSSGAWKAPGNHTMRVCASLSCRTGRNRLRMAGQERRVQQCQESPWRHGRSERLEHWNTGEGEQAETDDGAQIGDEQRCDGERTTTVSSLAAIEEQ